MSRNKKIIWSTVISIVMLFFSYWVTNLQFPISGEKEVIGIFEAIRSRIYEPKDTTDSNVILIDLDDDKQLIARTNKYGKPLGNEYPVTNRLKLARLLKALKEKKDYAYILLDVEFVKGEETDADSVLFSTISGMERIVIPCDTCLEYLSDTCLYKKAALAYYKITPIESDFVKYPYIYEVNDTTLLSIPLRMYKDITKREINRHGLIYPIYTDRFLARKSIVLNLNYIPDSQEWLKLGNDILYRDAINNISTKDKYIIIGSAENDMHATYCGRISGAIINFNAFQALLKKHHIISPTLMIVLFVSFFIFSYLILSRRKLSESLVLRKSCQSKCMLIIRRILIALCSWIGFSTYLSILCILTYVYLEEVYDIFITSSAFYLINITVKSIHYYCYAK